MIKKILDPYKIFISLLIAAAFWLAPIGVGVEQIPVAGQITPLQEFSDIPKLNLAIVPEVSAACAPKCMEAVCLKWVPIGGSCQPTNPWDIGCCTRYGTVCNEELPGCGPEEPPPPPSYSPPTVSAALTCTTWGNAGWCINNGAIAISAVDPQGFAMTISGSITVNGSSTPYSCANPCSLSMPSGSGTVTYTATAATSGLSSGTGSIAFYFDPGNPVITSSTSGAQSGSWHTSAGATVTVLSSDAISGLQSVSITRNGIAVTSPFSLADGTHTITVIATDVAGNQYTSSFTVKVDSVKPIISFSTTGLLSGAWYRSATVAVAATDATSGLQTLLITDNGFSKSSPIALFDGVHTIFATAADNAGNVQAASTNIQVDGTPPAIVPTITGTSGSNGWYTSNAQVSVSATDAVSGLDTLKVAVDGDAWQIYTAPISLSDGLHTIQFQSTDLAGNISTTNVSVKVDTVPPAQTLVLNGTTGLKNWYVSNVLGTIKTSDATSGNVVTTITDNGGAAQSDPITLTEGIHNLLYASVDAAGNSVSASAVVSVDTTPPTTILSSPAPNSVGIGTVQIGGQSTDSTSGLSINQISFDNLNWLSLPLNNSDWSYAWETADLPNGALSIFARSIDQAGNIGIPSQIKVVLDNHPPFLELSQSWNIWEGGALSVQPNVTPLKSVRIFIKDPLMRYPNELFFDDLPAPKQISWDRIIGNVTAPPGSYSVEVEACDIYGVCSKATGTIIIPEGIPTPTPELFLFPPPITKPPVIAPTQVVIPVQLPQVVVIPPETTPPIVVPPPKPVWPAAIAAMLLFMFAILLSFDPRPAALRSLAKTIYPTIRRVDHDR
jgi:hypothetical protein